MTNPNSNVVIGSNVDLIEILESCLKYLDGRNLMIAALKLKECIDAVRSDQDANT